MKLSKEGVCLNLDNCLVLAIEANSTRILSMRRSPRATYQNQIVWIVDLMTESMFSCVYASSQAQGVHVHLVKSCTLEVAQSGIVGKA